MTKSYDATTHFETTSEDIMRVYKQVTGKDFDFSACKVSPHLSFTAINDHSSVQLKTHLKDKATNNKYHAHLNIFNDTILEPIQSTFFGGFFLNQISDFQFSSTVTSVRNMFKSTTKTLFFHSIFSEFLLVFL